MKTRLIACLSLLMSLVGIEIVVSVSANQDTGTIQGKVSLNATAPVLPQIVVDKTVHICGEMLIDPILMVQEGGVKDAVVWVELEDEFHTTVKPQPPISLKSQNCLFHPRIQAAKVGTYLHLSSGDKTAHNPHGWWNNERTVFNITLLDPSLKFKRKLRWAGIYRIECDTHTWMKSYIWIFKHPFFAVSDEKGKFLLKNVPVGRHTVKMWHEILGEHTAEVVVEAKKEAQQYFVVPFADYRREELKPKTMFPWPPSEEHP